MVLRAYYGISHEISSQVKSVQDLKGFISAVISIGRSVYQFISID